MSDISVIGSGSWATAQVKILTDNGLNVSWWLRDHENIDFIQANGYNAKYLRTARLDVSRLYMTDRIAEAVRASEVVIFASPAAFLADICKPLPRDIFEGRSVVSAIKGLEPESRLPVSRWFAESFNLPRERFAVVAGPCHAEEVAQELSAYLTIGAPDPALGEKVAAMLRRPNIRTHTQPDLEGMEYAAVLKNIYAVAAGIATGLNEGDNFKAVLVSAAAREMRDFLEKVAPGVRDIAGNAYLGDLLVTCYSQHSRNRTFGNMISHGYNVRSIQMEMNMIAEGYYALRGIQGIAQEIGIDMPIADATYRIVYEKVSPRMEFGLLRDLLN